MSGRETVSSEERKDVQNCMRTVVKVRRTCYLRWNHRAVEYVKNGSSKVIQELEAHSRSYTFTVALALGRIL
jgi:hypothetical protein